MILDGKTVAAKNYVMPQKDELFDFETQIQPNGIDLRVFRVFHLTGRSQLTQNGLNTKEMNVLEIKLKNGFFDLEYTNGHYLVDFMEIASMQPGISGQIVPRSSLVRVGVEVLAGWWDSGWEGRLGASLRVRNPIQLEYGVRLAQLIVHKSEFNGSGYAGTYQGLDSQAAFIA